MGDTDVSGYENKNDYTQIECDKKIMNNSEEYKNEINDLNEEYTKTMSNYIKDYATHKLELYEKDFFSAVPSDFYKKESDDVDEEYKIDDQQVDKQMKNFPFMDSGSGREIFTKMQKHMHTLSKTKFSANTDNGAVDNLKNVYNKNKRIAQSVWGTLIQEQTPVIEDIDNIDEKMRVIKTKIDTIRENIDKDVSSMQYCGSSVNSDIDELQAENKKLQQRINSLKGKNEGAVGKVFDAQLLYNQYYLGNVIISLVIVYVLYQYLKLYITDNVPEKLKKFMPISYKKILN